MSHFSGTKRFQGSLTVVSMALGMALSGANAKEPLGRGENELRELSTIEKVKLVVASHAGKNTYQLGLHTHGYGIEGDAIALNSYLSVICSTQAVVHEAGELLPIDALNYFDGVVDFQRPFSDAADRLRAALATGFRYAIMPKVCSQRIEGELHPSLAYGFLQSGKTNYLILIDGPELGKGVKNAKQRHQALTEVGYDLGDVSIERSIRTGGKRTYTLRAPIYSYDSLVAGALAINMKYVAEAEVSADGTCGFDYVEQIQAERQSSPTSAARPPRSAVLFTLVNEAMNPINERRMAVEISLSRSAPGLPVNRYVATVLPGDSPRKPIFWVDPLAPIIDRHAVRFEMPAVSGWLAARNYALKNLDYLNMLDSHIRRDCEDSRGMADTAKSDVAALLP
ncbi:hypothetical protein [Allohahella marinimesophila]|uniref:Uncharacterized protein n=1 Tax=Allohahella marinimesophila TaxID=1054972 RepID=A0ABP7QAA2_9GAMM